MIKLKLKNRLQQGNRKPSRDFDEEFGIKLSQEYTFPLNLSEYDVWYAICESLYSDDDSLINIANNLSDEHFPYSGVEKLDFSKKFDILYGMVSNFNYDDIVWYAINDVKACTNPLNYISLLPPSIDNKIRWVISPPTLIKMYEHFDIISNF